MSANLNKLRQWKADIAKSVDMYNDWFMKFAPQAFRTTRLQTTQDVEAHIALDGQHDPYRSSHSEAASRNPSYAPHVHLFLWR